ncbi:DNA phosphorothioation-dependent restriction protein DptG [Bacillus thuringiensis]|uniref:Uncharacterized protein n=1 Tax=Bacillus thuringiensis TaxID=1428 RepID=A0A9W3X4S7_BACTU|nr:restriction endonuclease [Bacillus thuringiensis]ANS52398.1 hypothetical protein BT246_71080 [Bacillus thuringiensis]MBH0340576.1 DNA phosphorothioation-dependent restriction protein DptG [Bacillus thuringiensis]
MAKKSAKEKLQELEEQMKRLKEEERDLKRKAKAEEKKKRDKLCKDTGELIEKCFDVEHLSLEERELLFSSISSYVNNEITQNFPRQKDDSEEENGGSSEDELKEPTVTSSVREFQIS